MVRRTWSPTRRARTSWEARVEWLVAHRRLWWSDPDHPPADLIVPAMQAAGLVSPQTLAVDCALRRLVRAAHERALAQHLEDVQAIRNVRYLAEAHASIAAALAVLETRVTDAEHRVTHARLARRADVLCDQIEMLTNDLTIDVNGWESPHALKESVCDDSRQLARRVS